jgi:5-formyltetrahydrofolate cyclo-ligase
MADKISLRKSLLARREQLTAEEMSRAGEQALQQAIPLLQEKRLIMLYMPFRGELSTLPLARWLEDRGLPLVLPLTNRQQRRITPVLVEGLGQLAPGAYGILEPAGAFQATAAGQLDAVVVPGVGFDQHGFRIGYGGGYYDRFLPRLRPDCLTMGYGYDWQVVPELTPDPWDQSLQYIVTDCRVITALDPK